MTGAGELGFAALFAGVAAIGVTVAIEKLGGRLGGLIGTLPTTIVPASLGIYAGTTEGEPFAAAMGAVPVGMLLNALFLLCWRELPPRLPAWSLHRRLGLMVLLSLSVWLASAVAAVMGLSRLTGWVFEAGVVATLIMLFIGVAACRRNPPAPRGKRTTTLGALLARGVLAAGAIAAAVAIAQAGAELAAGVASVFPAIFLTTMVGLWWSQGEAVPAGAVGPMMLGSCAVAAYALIAAILFPMLGPTLGSFGSWWAAALAVTLPAWLWLRSLQPAA